MGSLLSKHFNIVFEKKELNALHMLKLKGRPSITNSKLDILDGNVHFRGLLSGPYSSVQ